MDTLKAVPMKFWTPQWIIGNCMTACGNAEGFRLLWRVAARLPNPYAA